MAKLKYPIGIQSFPALRQGGYAYVDKTRYVSELIDGGKYLFLSRPRRFGKSLMLSTVRAYFEGRRELFTGLELDSMGMDWTPRPVLYFDFNTGSYTLPDGLVVRLHKSLSNYEKLYGIEEQDQSEETLAVRFETLIQAAYESTGREVVILIDEYDKALLEVEENRELFERHQALLKAFFGNLKSMDEYIHFAMLTGVARFNKVSIFSDINHLKDISMSDRYADICGWTEAEVVATFEEGIKALAHKHGKSEDTTIAALRNYYDGYLFSEGGNRLYNPFSVLRALDECSIEPYWFSTATPTFLASRVKKYGIDPGKLNDVYARKEDLLAVGMAMMNPVPLMFQTGYLTIGSYDYERQRYELRFPNTEVEIGFAKFLMPLYVPEIYVKDSVFNIELFRDNLYEGHPAEFMERLRSLFRNLPGEDHQESTYRAITYLLSVLSGTEVQAERHGYKGRSDLEVATSKYIYLFEFKYNRSVREAMAQIHERDYAGRLAMDPRTVYLIGANYAERKDSRDLSYEIEELRK